jgi:hypothetical protein
MFSKLKFTLYLITLFLVSWCNIRIETTDSVVSNKYENTTQERFLTEQVNCIAYKEKMKELAFEKNKEFIDIKEIFYSEKEKSCYFIITTNSFSSPWSVGWNWEILLNLFANKIVMYNSMPCTEYVYSSEWKTYIWCFHDDLSRDWPQWNTCLDECLNTQELMYTSFKEHVLKLKQK